MNRPEPQGSINSGYGEYCVFSLTGAKVSREAYDSAYTVIEENSLSSIARSNLQNKTEAAAKRLETIRERLKKIDPNLKVSFIPRVLYELLFIRKCLKEETRDKQYCSYCYTGAEKTIEKNPEKEKEIQADIITRKCWHAKTYGPEAYSQDKTLRNYAFRLNKAIVKTLKPCSVGFTYEQFKQKVQAEIQFLKEHYKSFKPFENWKGESLIYNLSAEGMFGIANDSHAQLILKTLELECTIGTTSFILYRGSKGNEDSVLSIGGKTPHSLSYGTGLFAGCVFDSTATAFYYLRYEECNAFAFVVPVDQLSSSIFHVPQGNALAQLLGRGELFHCRTKHWKGYQSYDDIYKSDIEKEELVKQFQAYTAKAIFLKPKIE